MILLYALIIFVLITVLSPLYPTSLMAGIDQRLEKTRRSINKEPCGSISDGVLSDTVSDIVCCFSLRTPLRRGWELTVTK